MGTLRWVRRGVTVLTGLTPREIRDCAESLLGIQLVPRSEKRLTPRGYTSVCQVLGDIDYVWVYSIGSGVAVHRSHNKGEIESLYTRSTGEENQQLRAKLKKLQAKTKHHLAERDRYRDLYLESERKRREWVTNNPNF